MRIRLSPKAESDLAAIWDYGATHWGTARADGYLDGLRDRMVWLVDHAALWQERGDIAPGVFRQIQGAHLIFFREMLGGIEIIRILHQSMDAPRHV